MKPSRTYSIIHTFLDKHGHLITRPSTGIRGCTEKEALDIYRTHVASARRNKRLLGVVLVDAADNVLAEWARPAGKVAA